MLLTSLLLLIGCITESLGLKVVETSYGKVRGITEWSDDKNKKYIFKSVPFAKPPIGDLRFALPENPNAWNGVLDASKYSPACMSNTTQTSHPQENVSEDCLYINIFTSERCLLKKCSVIVYYHGGGYDRDSAVMFPDKFILDRYVGEDVVFAIPAVRLGVFGQLYFGPSSVLNENLFAFDAVQALNFVHSEISNFGGNPGKVTIMGHSSGASLVEALGFSEILDPDLTLFQQMIILSATGVFGFPELSIENSFIFTEKLNCLNGTREDANVSEMLKCLRELDGHDLLLMQREMEDFDRLRFSSLLRGAPFMKLNGKISELKNNTSPRNLLVGTTEHEFRADAYRPPFITGTFLDFDNPVAVARHYEDLLMDHLEDWPSGDSAAVFVSSVTYSQAMALTGADVFIFETTQRPYSFHVSDMQYFVGVHREVWRRPDMDILDTFYSKLLVNFTKYGEPSPVWKKLDPEQMNYLDLKVNTKLGEGPVMKKGYHDKEMDMWFDDMMAYDKNITSELKSQGLEPAKHDYASQGFYPGKNDEPHYSTVLHPQTPATKETTQPSATKKTVMTTPDIISKSPSSPSPSYLPQFSTTPENPNLSLKSGGSSIFSQWWFYLIIVLVVLIFVLVVISLCKSKSEEEMPLIR